MTTLSINDTATASTTTIEDVVRRTLTENFAESGYNIQFCLVDVKELDNDDGYRFISVTLDGVFFPKETGTDRDTWVDHINNCIEFKAIVSIVFDSPDDREPDGGFHGVKVENSYGHEMIAKVDVADEEWPKDGKTSEDTLRNLTHCLITKGEGYPDV